MPTTFFLCFSQNSYGMAVILIRLSNNADTICLAISEPSLSFVAANDSLNSNMEFGLRLSTISLILLSSSSNFPLFMVVSSSRL